jgi:hypothetical protein
LRLQARISTGIKTERLLDSAALRPTASDAINPVKLSNVLIKEVMDLTQANGSRMAGLFKSRRYGESYNVGCEAMICFGATQYGRR